MLNLTSVVKGLKKKVIDKKDQHLWEKLTTNEKLDKMLQTVNRVNEELT